MLRRAASTAMWTWSFAPGGCNSAFFFLCIATTIHATLLHKRPSGGQPPRKPRDGDGCALPLFSVSVHTILCRTQAWRDGIAGLVVEFPRRRVVEKCRQLVHARTFNFDYASPRSLRCYVLLRAYSQVCHIHAGTIGTRSKKCRRSRAKM